MDNVKAACIFLIGSDQTTTHAINSLCEQKKLMTQCFHTWDELNTKIRSRTPACVIVSDCLGEQHHQPEKITYMSQNLHVPVIVLGRQHNLPSAVASIQAGAMDYIEKPAIIGRLSQHISNLVGTQ